MDISVAICTWQRNESLRRTLTSLTQLQVPSDLRWELLVTNNCECAEADAIIDSFASSLPLRRINETRLGLCYARNRAISEVCGEYVLWTDDDVLVDSMWLANYWAAIKKYPAADFFGGPISLEFATPPESWIANNLGIIGGAYASLDLGPDVRLFHTEEAPFGANMAIRRSTLFETAFDPALGPVGSSQIRGDESDLFGRLPANCHGVWVGNARVTHCISRERLTLKYIWDYYEGYGRTLVRRNRYKPPSARTTPWKWLLHRKQLYRYPLSMRTWVRAMRKAAIVTGINHELAQVDLAKAAGSSNQIDVRPVPVALADSDSSPAGERS